MPKPLIVQFTPIKSSLVNLPSKWVNALLDQKKLPQNVIIEIGFQNEATKQEKKVYCGWSGEASKQLHPNSVFTHGANGKLDVLEMDPQLGLALGIHDGQKVNVEFCRNVPECTTVYVEPLTEDDWEILELHAGYVEENLLSQIRSVYPHQIMCVWIHGKTLVRLAVGEIQPGGEKVKLTNQTEVIVSPKVRQKSEESRDLNSQPKPHAPTQSLRLSPLTVPAHAVHLHPASLQSIQAQDRLKITKLPSTDLAVYGEITLDDRVPIGHVALGSSLQLTLELAPFDRLKLTKTSLRPSPISSVVLRKYPGSVDPPSDALKGRSGFASQGLVLEIEGHAYAVQWPTSEEAYGPLAVSVELGEDLSQARPVLRAPRPEVPMGGVDRVFEKILDYGLAHLSQRDLKSCLAVPGSGGVLISGAHGSGKTSLVKKLLKPLEDAHIYTMEINCSELADERVPTFKESLQKWFDQAAWHAPTLMFLDDLDRLIPAEVEHADSTRSRHLAELFVRVAQIACQRHPIMLIATTQQQQSLHPALITHHIFSELKHLQPPNREERKLMMQVMMENGPSVLQKSLPSIDLVAVASETEGFLAADIKAFIERTVHEGAVRSIKENINQHEASPELQLIQADFIKAKEGFVPSSLRGVKLQSSGVHWSDIGGLNETRKTLLETLEWPTKYASVFSQCPLRLRSGLLLYGYPGCGKTLLASAVAKECGLNFISVKGPEILNKYIGASEKSVRDLFERAQAAKPCVLFFDEFDSIAPRRGHDSTGVTDRVVNQMLTQMDGAEGLDGVYVLAATSRPDLIDPALLRPGRLDKALLCGLPSFEERLEILQALSRKMKLSNEIDLKIYAEKTEGFSGADLQGFLYNAHLEAIHGAINIETFKEIQNNKSNSKANEKSDFIMNQQKKVPLTLAEKGQISQRLAMIKRGVRNNNSSISTGQKEEEQKQVSHEAIITNKHLEKSLNSTRPSITTEEAHRLRLIYNEFVTGRTGELPNGEGDKGIGKRSTLG